MMYIHHHNWVRGEMAECRSCNLNWSLLLHLLLLFIFLSTSIISSAPDPPPPPPTVDACTSRDCGEGSCRVTTTILGSGFECDCYPGWSKFLWSPYCVIPNCSINLNCGATPGTPPLPPPPPPPPPPPAPFLSLPPLGCFLVVCGDGECVADGINRVCNCNANSANLLDTPSFPCLPKCSLGVDCNNVTLGRPQTQPPPPPSTSSSPPSSMGGTLSPALAPNGSRNYNSLSILLLASIALLFI